MSETFVLPVTEPWRGYTSSWRDSLLVIMDIAADNWVKVSSNNEKQCYDIEEKKYSRIQPVWPIVDFEEVLILAFAGDLFIDNTNHPVLDALFIE